LRRASDLIRKTFPDVEVVPYLINFEGIWQEQEGGNEIQAAD
jgi:hypothetical protein